MQLARVHTLRAGVDSVLHLPQGSVEKPSAERDYAVRDGVLVALDSPLLVIHGGAGVERADLSADDEVAARLALESALRAGHKELAGGKPALDAVTAAITVLEDAPQFNAGRGAVFNHDGKNELDSSIMDGASHKAGAVAGVHRVKNPILLARAVMEKSRHVMMVGDGAEAFAVENGFRLVDPSYFRTEKRWQQLQRALQEEREAEAQGHFPGTARQGLFRHRRCTRTRCQGPSGGGHLDRRHDQQALWSRGRFPHHRRRHLGRCALCGFRNRMGRVLHPRIGCARDLRARASFRTIHCTGIGGRHQR
jgi:hypothetical protein